MSSECECFRASDAFAYVDAYRRLILSPIAKIKVEKERLDEMVWGMQLVPTRTYAELRAHEDALKFVSDGEEPGTVRLFDPKAKDERNAEEVEAREALKEKELEATDLKNKLRVLQDNEHLLKAELVRRGEEIKRLKRKMSNTYNNLAVAGTTAAIVVVVFIFVQFFR